MPNQRDLKTLYPTGVSLLDSVKVRVPAAGTVEIISARPLRIDGISEGLVAFLGKLGAGLSWDALDPLLDVPGARSLLVELDRRDLLVERLPDDIAVSPRAKQLRWLSHFVPGPLDAQARFGAVRALVLGCGGTGSLVAMHLASMGIGELVLVDCDTVEITNFNRQFPFRREHLGHRKEEALATALSESNPETRISTHHGLITTAPALVAIARPGIPGPRSNAARCGESIAAGRPLDVIFCCADTPVGYIAALVAEAAIELDCACVFGSVGLTEAAIGPLLWQPGPLRRFATEMRELGAIGETVIGGTAMSASFSPVNTVTAAWMVHAWAEFALGLRSELVTNQSIVIDLRTAALRSDAYWGER